MGHKMAQVRLNVPLIPQQRSMSCWYACVCMVKYYVEMGPRYGNPDAWHANTGLGLEQVRALAKTENLDFLNSATHDFTAVTMMVTLSFRGPIWAAGEYDGYGHVMVITGAKDDGTLFFNDPEHGGSRREHSVSWFNKKRYRGFLLVNPVGSRPLGVH